MAPEQAEGKKIDQRTDIYALGLVLYELFTGEMAFTGDTPVAVAHKQVHETPTTPTQVDPDLPPRLERAILKCLEKAPKHRFQSVNELEAALEEDNLAISGTAPEAEPVPAPHLSVWGRLDWVLLVLGVAGLFYFLSFHDSVFPASEMQLEVDAITARREAEAVAEKLGRPFDQFQRAKLVYDPFPYRAGLVAALAKKQDSAERRETLRQIELPLFWKVSFTGASDSLLWAEGRPVERYVLVDRTGKVREFHSPHGQLSLFLNYQPAELDTRRRLAKAAAQIACGSRLPENLLPVETSGGRGGASYNVTWSGVQTKISVSLREEKTTDIICRYPPETPATVASQWDDPERVFQGLLFVILLILFSRIAFSFGMGESSRSGLLRQRLPLAILVGFSGTGLLASLLGLDWNSFRLQSELVSSAILLLLVAFASSGILLVGLVTVEHNCRRWASSWIASYSRLLRGRLWERDIGLSVVRGALAGLVMAALETVLVQISLVLPLTKTGGTVVMSPDAVGEAAASFSPALFVLAAALVNSLVLTVLLVGYELADSQKTLRKITSNKMKLLYKITPPLAFGASVFYWKVVFPFGLGQLTGPGVSSFFALILLGTFAGIILYRYDALTSIVTVVTAVIFTLNYPLLVILSEVGNAPQWGVFIGWGVVVAAALLVAFRQQFERRRQQMAEDLQ